MQSARGTFPPGHNGPYYDNETPVRNTAHYLITLIKAYEISNDKNFYTAAQHAAEFLCSPVARPMKGSFFCRMNPQKDFCNGLIGQAWVIEALAAAARCFNDEKYQTLAREIFLLHPFDHRFGLWQRLSVDGSHLPYDATFNHQLWFAASGTLIAADKKDEIFNRVNFFLEKAARSHFKISRSGRISHPIPINTGSSPLQRVLKNIIYHVRISNQKKQIIEKEIGYHAFNLYALAMINSQIPDNSFFQNNKVRSALNYIQSNEFISGLENNPFSYPYNPCGFEVAYAIQIFPSIEDKAKRTSRWWINQQIKRTFSYKEKAFSINTTDANTLTARLYEAARLEDAEIKDADEYL